MFSEVRQAILPLALRNLKRRGDLERAGLLIESLAKHWCDSKPFQVLIVSPERDAVLLRGSLPRFRNIEVSVRAEGDFFPAFSRFYMMTGWYRQQMVKLHVPAKLGFGGYLTLDSDVCCVGDFDATTFIENGRALSRWAFLRADYRRERRNSNLPAFQTHAHLFMVQLGIGFLGSTPTGLARR